jgi:TolB-like protein/Tfp pilus assembly protein PilF
MSEGSESEQRSAAEAKAPGPEQSVQPERAAFISYASADKAAADSIVAALEGAGIGCWIAPRDVVPGVFYADAIVQAINAARILIVVLTFNSADSQHVLREVERASSKNRPLVAFRLHPTPLPTGLEYFLSASHWLDASSSTLSAALPQLILAVRQLLEQPASPVPVGPVLAAAPESGPSRSFWMRLKEHKVAQWTVAYAAFAFAALRGVALLIDAFGWPHEVLRVSTIVMLIGLPIVSILAWYHGVKALKRVTGSELLLIGLLLVVGGGLLWLIPQPRAKRAETPATIVPGEPSIAKADFAPPPHSIAVLPFVNMSGDLKQEYFSDGITEELLNSLSHLSELQVVARTSSFSFKGQNVDVATIARKLNVGTVMEGSVRRAGNTVRITVQLINATNGFHMWSQTYDRSLSDILRVQKDVANSVAQQLQITLAASDFAKVELGGTQNSDAYDAYLRGKQIMRGPNAHGETTRDALAALDKAIALDPNFAKAYADRAWALQGIYINVHDPEQRAALRDQARTAAQRGVALAPDLGETHAALAAIRAYEYFDYAGAAPEFARALALSPGNANVQWAFAWYAADLGHFDQAISAARRAVSLDPENATPHGALAFVLSYARRYPEALAAYQRVKVLRPESRGVDSEIAQTLLASGQVERARQTCESPITRMDDDERHHCLALAYHYLGRQTDAEGELAKYQARDGDGAAYSYAGIYSQWGDVNNALQWLTKAEELRDPILWWLLRIDWQLDPIRNEPRFKAIEARMNFPP